MREIKFRAWDKSCNRMFNTITEVWFGNNDYFKELFFDQAFYFKAETKTDSGVEIHQATSEDCILMQYTGLKDKNGVEIYEGDIISYGGKWRAHVDFGELKFWGGYDSDDYYGIGFRVGSMPLDPRGEPLEYIVIGNIWENPELMENKS